MLMSNAEIITERYEYCGFCTCSNCPLAFVCYSDNENSLTFFKLSQKWQEQSQK